MFHDFTKKEFIQTLIQSILIIMGSYITLLGTMLVFH